MLNDQVTMKESHTDLEITREMMADVTIAAETGAIAQITEDELNSDKNCHPINIKRRKPCHDYLHRWVSLQDTTKTENFVHVSFL